MGEVLQIEVRVVCPKCGGRYHVCGQEGAMIYRECKEAGCGFRGKTLRVSQAVLTAMLRREELSLGEGVRVVSVEVRGGARD